MLSQIIFSLERKKDILVEQRDSAPVNKGEPHTTGQEADPFLALLAVISYCKRLLTDTPLGRVSGKMLGPRTSEQLLKICIRDIRVGIRDRQSSVLCLLCSALLYCAVYCAVLCCAVLYRAVYCAVRCCAVPCRAVLCCVVLCCVVLCCVVLCCVVRRGYLGWVWMCIGRYVAKSSIVVMRPESRSVAFHRCTFSLSKVHRSGFNGNGRGRCFGKPL